MSAEKDGKLTLFEGRQLRKIFHEGGWWFVIVDVVAVLSGSANPSSYLRDMCRRDLSLAEALKGGGQFAPPPLPWSSPLPVAARNFHVGILRASSA